MGGTASAPAAEAAPPPRQTNLTATGVRAVTDSKRRIADNEKKRDLKLKVAEKQYEMAKAARVAGNTHKAKHHLKQRQMALDAATKYDAIINKLVVMQNAMEQQQTNKEFVESMAGATHILKANAVDADKATDVMTDASIAVEQVQDATDVLTGTTLMGEDMLDAQADDELAALEAEMAAEQAAATAAAPAAAPAVAAPAPATTGVTAAAAAALPQAPAHSVGVVSEAEVDAELAALEAEMA